MDEPLRYEAKRVNQFEEAAPSFVRVVLISSSEELRRYTADRLCAELVSFSALPDFLLYEDVTRLLGELRVDVLFDPLRLELACDSFRASEPAYSLGTTSIDVEGQVTAFFAEGGYDELPGVAKFGKALRTAPVLPEMPVMAAEGDQELRLLCPPHLRGEENLRAQLAQRLQLLSALCIDNGTVANIAAQGWWVGLLFAQEQLAGFLTLFTFPNHRGTRKMRISQLLIFPPFQRRGLCRLALQAVYNRFLPDEGCTRITVEAPTPYFQVLRFRFLVKMLAGKEALLELARTCRVGEYGDTSALLAAVEGAVKTGKESTERLVNIFLYFEAEQAGAVDSFKAFYLEKLRKMRMELSSQAKTAYKRKFICFDGQPTARSAILALLKENDSEKSSSIDILEDELIFFAQVCPPLVASDR